jgi:hypothetical protein
VENGQWVVKEKMIERSSLSLSNHGNTQMGVNGYSWGDNSLGIHMEYRPLAIGPGSSPIRANSGNMHATTPKATNRDPKPNRYADCKSSRLEILTSDYKVFLFPGGCRKLFLLSARGGISDAKVIACSCAAPPDNFGLKIDFKARGDARCADTYRTRLKEFAQELQKFSFVLTVLQTLIAAWPKWGRGYIGQRGYPR